MNDRMEDQIRHYTQAVYATKTPIAQLAPSLESEAGAEYALTSVVVGRQQPPPPGRSLTGAAVAVVGVLVVMLLAVPIWLMGGDAAPTTPTDLFDELDPFTGVWTGVDERDGSTNTLIVERDTRGVTFSETGATACSTRFGEFAAATATGSATVEGATLTFTGTLYCELSSGRRVHPGFQNFEWTFRFDPETDTVTLSVDEYTVFRRVEDG